MSVAEASGHFLIIAAIFELAANDQCSPSQRTYFPYIPTALQHQMTSINVCCYQTVYMDYCAVLRLLVCYHSIIKIGRQHPTVTTLVMRMWDCFTQLRACGSFTSKQLHRLEVWLICVIVFGSLRSNGSFDQSVMMLKELRLAMSTRRCLTLWKTSQKLSVSMAGALTFASHFWRTFVTRST